MNLIAGTPLELKYSLKFILNFKWWTSFEIGQSAAKTKILFKTRLCKVQRLSRNGVHSLVVKVSGNGEHPIWGWRYSPNSVEI